MHIVWKYIQRKSIDHRFSINLIQFFYISIFSFNLINNEKNIKINFKKFNAADFFVKKKISLSIQEKIISNDLEFIKCVRM